MGNGREWISSPCTEGRVSVVVLPLPFSSCTSCPSTQFTSVDGKPVLPVVKGTSVLLLHALPWALMVYTVRADGLQVAVEADGLLPLRITSATPPFST